MRVLILIVCIILGVAAFSTQNSMPVSVTLLAWDFKASLAIIIFLSATGGVILGILASFLLRLSKRTRSANKKTQPVIPRVIQ
jgi:uncharacterized integral membrane protein